MFGKLLENVRNKKPLIHNITNYVTVNDCANVVIAIGASPIMSDDKNEVADITSICSGLNINIGTLNERTIESMLISGKKANEINIPTVLDPVGAGASWLRTQTALNLLDKIKFTVIRGNISEIKALANGCASTKGVDADVNDEISPDNPQESIDFIKRFAKETKAVIAVTGAVDIVANEHRAFLIKNGHPMLADVTGTGCQLSAMTAAFIAANSDCPLEAAAAAVSTMGIAGEKAYERMSNSEGNSSYRNYVIDAIYSMTAEQLEEGARYEMY